MDYKVISDGLLKSNLGEGTIRGIGNLYGAVDEGNDRVLNGAAADSLKRRKVRFLDNHQTQSAASSVGAITKIWEVDKSGLITAGGQNVVSNYPDTTGALLFEAKFNLEHEGSKAIYQGYKFGYLDSFSIGYSIPKDGDFYTTENGNRIRNIKQLELFEISATPFPMSTGSQALQIMSHNNNKLQPNDLISETMLNAAWSDDLLFYQTKGYPNAAANALANVDQIQYLDTKAKLTDDDFFKRYKIVVTPDNGMLDEWVIFEPLAKNYYSFLEASAKIYFLNREHNFKMDGLFAVAKMNTKTGKVLEVVPVKTKDAQLAANRLNGKR